MATTSAATAKKKNENDVKEFSTSEKITALYELQLVDSRIDEINQVKGSLPLEIEDIENNIEGANSLIERYLSEADDAMGAVKIKKEEIEEAKNLIAKYQKQQQDVRNNREFESFGKEIEYQNLEIELCEKRIKEFTAEAKSKKKMSEEAGEILEDRKKELEVKKGELDSIEKESEDEVKSLVNKGEELKTKIDERLLTAYERIRKNTRNGLAVVTVQRDACGGCFNRIPPQRQIDIEASKKVIVCEYCGRVLVSSSLDE